MTQASKGKALITGARGGIGRAIALALAGEGFDGAACDLALSEDLETVARQTAAKGVRAQPVADDISDLAAHDQILDEAEAAIGPLTCLINNAGVSVMSRGDLLDVTPQ